MAAVSLPLGLSLTLFFFHAVQKKKKSGDSTFIAAHNLFIMIFTLSRSCICQRRLVLDMSKLFQNRTPPPRPPPLTAPAAPVPLAGSPPPQSGFCGCAEVDASGMSNSGCE